MTSRLMTRMLGGFALAACITLPACSGGAEVGAVRRGDESFAQGNFDEALAEYRLAIRQGADDPAVVARVAHTFSLMNRVDDAGAYYVDAVARDPDLADQAVSDLMRLARSGQAAGDRFNMATAVETALELRPGVGVGEMSLPLARHYYENGEYGRALPFYQKAMAEARDSIPEIVFEVGRAHDEIGDCENALIFFERFSDMVRPWERGEVDWYIGTCAFKLARELRDRSTSRQRPGNPGIGPDGLPVSGTSDLEEALRLLDRTVEVGEPRNIQAQAWFEKGEILAEMGRCDAAMEAYSQVRYADQAGSLIDRAQDRFDEIYFGRGLEHLREGRCR